MRLSWKALYRQFGADPSKASDARTVDNFQHGLSEGVEENQDRMAGAAVPDCHWGVGRRPLAAVHPAQAPAHLATPRHSRNDRPPPVPGVFPQNSVIPGSFPRHYAKIEKPESSTLRQGPPPNLRHYAKVLK